MKFLLTLVLATAAAASGVANAAQYSSDEDRRSQNREEALSKWRAANGQAVERPVPERSSVRQRARDSTQSVKNFTKRQAATVRDFGERQDRRLDRRFGKRANINANPDGGGGK